MSSADEICSDTNVTPRLTPLSAISGLFVVLIKLNKPGPETDLTEWEEVSDSGGKLFMAE